MPNRLAHVLQLRQHRRLARASMAGAGRSAGMPAAWWRWALPLATALVYAYLVIWLNPQLEAAAGGRRPFDLRWAGYGLAEARDFLAALGPQATALYRGPIRTVDTLVPVLLAATLVLPLHRRALACCLPALAYGVLDLAENAAVATLLAAGPLVDAGPVALASALTQAKFGAATLAVAIAAWGLRAGRRS